MKKLKHVMIDLETLATVPSARIVSIGAVIFDPRYGRVGDTLYLELDHAAQNNRTKCPDTVKWWKKQPVEVRKALSGTMSLEDALEELAFFLPENSHVWGNGSIFDIAMLEDAYRDCELEIPWKFWQVLDMRTIKYLFECSRGQLGGDRNNTVHNALDDAYYQAKQVNKMWTKILKP